MANGLNAYQQQQLDKLNQLKGMNAGSLSSNNAMFDPSHYSSMQDWMGSDLQYQAAAQEYADYPTSKTKAILDNRTAQLQQIWNSDNPQQGMIDQNYQEQTRQAQQGYDYSIAHPDGGDSWVDNLMPWAIAALAVVATAGAGAAALGAAEGAGTSVAAGGAAGAAGAGAIDAAVTSAVTTAAAASPEVAAAVASIPQVVITGAAGGSAVSGGALLGAIGATAGVGAIAAGAGGSSGTSQPTNQNYDPQSTNQNGQVPTVTVTGTPNMPTNGLPNLSGIGGVSIPEDSLPPLGLPTSTPDPSIPNSDITPEGGTNLGNLPGGLPGGLNQSPGYGLPGGAGGNSTSMGPNWLIPGLIGTALGSYLNGHSSTPDNPNLSASINSLTDQSKNQMAQWNDWMFPTLKGALDEQHTAAQDYLNHSNSSASQLEGMGSQQALAAKNQYDSSMASYKPVADKIIADANAFDKQGYGAQQAGLALGDLQSAYAAQHQQQMQNLAAYGISPTSGRALAMDQAGSISNSANAASAATRARMAAEDLWGQKQMNALNTSGVINNIGSTYNTMNQGAGALYSNANNIRGQGYNAMSNYFTNADSLANVSNNTYATANSGYNSAGNLALGQSNLDNQRYMAEEQGKGTVLGAGLSALGGGNTTNVNAGGSSGSGSSGSGSGLNLGNIVNAGKSVIDWGSKLFG